MYFDVLCAYLLQSVAVCFSVIPSNGCCNLMPWLGWLWSVAMDLLGTAVALVGATGESLNCRAWDAEVLSVTAGFRDRLLGQASTQDTSPVFWTFRIGGFNRPTKNDGVKVRLDHPNYWENQFVMFQTTKQFWFEAEDCDLHRLEDLRRYSPWRTFFLTRPSTQRIWTYIIVS